MITLTPSQEYLQECFAYNDDLGGLYWRVRPPRHFKTTAASASSNARFAGRKAGVACPKGYVRIKLDGKTFGEHRLVWKHQKGTEPPAEIDHDDRQRANNRVGNLLDTTRSANCINRDAGKNNTSGFKGVDWNNGKWRARICINRKSISLGRFDRLEDAAAAYMIAVAEHFGPMAAIPSVHRSDMDTFLATMAAKIVATGIHAGIPGVNVHHERKPV